MKTIRLAAAIAASALLLSACGSGSSYGDDDKSDTPSSSSSSSGAAAVQLKSGSAGTYLADAEGRSLYLLTADKGSTSTCSGACATNWPPLTTTGVPKAMGKVEADDLGTTKRADGTTQVTFYGHPLYYFKGDSGAGSTSGQGIESFGGYWWLVDSSGKAIESKDESSDSDGTGGY